VAKRQLAARVAGRRTAALPQVMGLQRGPVTDQPKVAEWVEKAALPVNAPGRFVVADLVDAAIGPSLHGALDEGVRIVEAASGTASITEITGG
jgi:hypothetical protein